MENIILSRMAFLNVEIAELKEQIKELESTTDSRSARHIIDKHSVALCFESIKVNKIRLAELQSVIDLFLDECNEDSIGLSDKLSDGSEVSDFALPVVKNKDSLDVHKEGLSVALTDVVDKIEADNKTPFDGYNIFAKRNKETENNV